MDNQLLLPSPFIKEDIPIKYWKDVRVKDWIILNDGRVCQVVDTYFHCYRWRDRWDDYQTLDGFVSAYHPPSEKSLAVTKDMVFGFYIRKNKTH